MPILVVNINDLPAATAVNLTDFFILADENGVAYKLTPALLSAFVGAVAASTVEYARVNVPTGGSNIVAVPEIVGKTVQVVWRSGMEAGLINSGSPVNDQVLADTTLGRLIFAATNPMGDGERITVQYK